MLVVAPGLDILILSQPEFLNCELTQPVAVEYRPLIPWEGVPKLIVDVCGERYLIIAQVV